MLTKNDLNSIGNLIDVKLESMFDVKLKPIHKDIGTIKRNLKKLDKKIDIISNFLDVHQLQIVKEVKKIQVHLNLPVMGFA